MHNSKVSFVVVNASDLSDPSDGISTPLLSVLQLILFLVVSVVSDRSDENEFFV